MLTSLSWVERFLHINKFIRIYAEFLLSFYSIHYPVNDFKKDSVKHSLQSKNVTYVSNEEFHVQILSGGVYKASQNFNFDDVQERIKIFNIYTDYESFDYFFVRTFKKEYIP